MNPPHAQFLPSELRTLSDEQLLACCRWEAFRGPGPGGQKRNKTSSAIRITHIATGLSATARELRSQAQNRGRALQRLRHRLALELREPLDPAGFRPPAWLNEILGTQKKLVLSVRDERYPAAMGLVVDLLSAVQWSVSDAASLLGVSTANLAKFLEADEKLWAKVNQERAAVGLRSLT